MNLDAEEWELPLTEHQRQFWSGQKLFPGGSRHDLCVAFRLPPIDLIRLGAAFDALVSAEPLLRAALREREGSPRLVPGERTRLETVDLRSGESGEVEPWLATRSREGFDLSRRLSDAALLLGRDGSSRLFLRLHHSIADGWAVKVLIERLAARYESPSAGERESPAPAFREHLEEERGYLRSGQFRRDRAFWGAHLRAAIRPTVFYGASGVGAPSGVIRIARALGPERTLRLRELAARLPAGSMNASLSNLLAAALLALLARITGNGVQSIGMPFLNRPGVRDRLSFGLFMQLGVLRLELASDETFSSLVRRVALAAAEAGRHVRYTVGNPLRRNFDVLFNFHNVGYPTLGGGRLEEEWIHSANDEMALSLHVRTTDPDNLLLQFDLNEGAFGKEWRRSQLVDHFLQTVDLLLLRPDGPTADLELGGGGQPHPSACRGTRRPLPAQRLEELFASEAARQGEAPAVLDGALVMTFRELDERSNRLAAAIRERAAGSSDAGAKLSEGAAGGRSRPHPTPFLVGGLLPRSAEAVVAFLAVLKAGGVWVPLDPRLPAARLAAIVKDAGLALAITSSRAGRAAAASADLLHRLVTVMELDGATGSQGPPGSLPNAHERAEPSGGASRGGTSDPAGSSSPDAPAYLLYTSGSTGTPKGALGSHRAALNRIRWMWNRYPFEPGEVGAHKTSLAFIDSVWEIFGPLLAGHCVLVVSEEATANPAALSALLARHAVRRIVLVPSLLHLLLEGTENPGQSLAGVRRWFVTGEPLAGELARRFAGILPGAQLYNLYGTTEFYDAACLPVGPEERAGDRVPIGDPIDNMSLYVLDRHLRPLPLGVPGELCVSGVAVPAGYHNRVEAPGTKFVANPFPEDGNPILFRTGDGARLLPGGRIEILGRLDNQVKLRGYRIEPEEIEHTLSRHEAVARSAVIVAHSNGGSPTLEAYVEQRKGYASSEGEILAFLRERLPAWMVPRVQLVDRLPLTATGKIDRVFLSEAAARPRSSRRARTAPRSAIEAALLAVWRRLLGVADIGVYDDFFDLGGHSLLALEAAAEIERTLGRKIPLSAIFEYPTVAALASGPLSSLLGNGRQLVALKPASETSPETPPLFTVPPAGSTVWSFAALARYLSPEQPLYSFEPRGIEEGEPPHHSIKEMARDYVAELRALQPHGPYSIAGRCFGGYVAFEMARQLRAAGEEISLLAIMDSKEAPLERDRQRSHSGVRKLFFYYPGRIVHYLRRHRLLYTLRVKAANETRYHLDRIARAFDRGRSPLRSRSRNLKILKYLHTRAYHRYVAAPYDGKVTLFWAGRSSEMTGEITRWRRLALGGLDCQVLPCRHFELLKEPYIQDLSRRISECLKQARSTSQPGDRSPRATPASRT